MTPFNILECAVIVYFFYGIHRMLGIAMRNSDALEDLRNLIGSLTTRTCAEFKEAHDGRERDYRTEYRLTPIDRRIGPASADVAKDGR